MLSNLSRRVATNALKSTTATATTAKSLSTVTAKGMKGDYTVVDHEYDAVVVGAGGNMIWATTDMNSACRTGPHVTRHTA